MSSVTVFEMGELVRVVPVGSFGEIVDMYPSGGAVKVVRGTGDPVVYIVDANGVEREYDSGKIMIDVEYTDSVDGVGVWNPLDIEPVE